MTNIDRYHLNHVITFSRPTLREGWSKGFNCSPNRHICDDVGERGETDLAPSICDCGVHNLCVHQLATPTRPLNVLTAKIFWSSKVTFLNFVWKIYFDIHIIRVTKYDTMPI